ncbi:prepilin-type N-terminal cleavage/methylation domain-containing protein [bacterium]|nr:MAG: prepilin-type N-terminal cleavage/methylation domain-containing protein [bacterium]
MLPSLKASKPAKAVQTLSLSLSEEDNSLVNSNKKHGFTLIELIVVIIIVGILAAVGITQYSLMVEKGRTASAKVRLGTMRQLAYQYWLENGDMTNIQNADVGVDATAAVCNSADYYFYEITGTPNLTQVTLLAGRCNSQTGGGGKTPDASRYYTIYTTFYPGTGVGTFHCQYWDNNAACFGMPS